MRVGAIERRKGGGLWFGFDPFYFFSGRSVSVLPYAPRSANRMSELSAHVFEYRLKCVLASILAVLCIGLSRFVIQEHRAAPTAIRHQLSQLSPKSITPSCITSVNTSAPFHFSNQSTPHLTHASHPLHHNGTLVTTLPSHLTLAFPAARAAIRQNERTPTSKPQQSH